MRTFWRWALLALFWAALSLAIYATGHIYRLGEVAGWRVFSYPHFWLMLVEALGGAAVVIGLYTRPRDKKQGGPGCRAAGSKGHGATVHPARVRPGRD